MVVKNTGYLKLEDVLELKDFSIYRTNKKTSILFKNCHEKNIYLYHPKHDRLPWKITEGKSICKGVKIFDSKINSLSELSTKDWNNGNQIMSYEWFSNY